MTTRQRADFVLSLIEAFRDPSVVSALKDATKADYDYLADQVAIKLEPRLSKLQRELDAKEKRIQLLESKVSELETKQDDIEQYSRRTSVRILGVSENPDEDVSSKVKDVFSTMGLHPTINRVHRVGPHRKTTKPDGTTSTSTAPRPILCQFLSYGDKAGVMKKRNILKDNLPHVYVNEDLTRKRSKLLFDARVLKNQKKIVDCWSSDGKILVKDKNRVISSIRNIVDLKRLVSEN